MKPKIVTDDAGQERLGRLPGHTPGPISITRADEFDKVHGRMHLRCALFTAPAPGDDGPNLVAYVEGIHDAALFAGATDLLAALFRAGPMLLLLAGKSDWPDEVKSCVEQVKAAIAKAKGVQS